MSQPKYYGLNELREMFLHFFETKGHLRLPSFSLIPQNDASLLLINSGMAPMKPFFTGEQEPPRHRVTTCQKCIRTPDIERVGITARHGTYFEMLGNFSFQDYFKKEVIPWAWEFLTKELEIPADRLYISVYQDDDEAYDIWTKSVGIPEDHMVRLGKEDNFWEHGSGPCGPCSEIYFDRGLKYGCGKPTCGVGCDCDRFMEIWNLVFSQYDSDGKGTYALLPKPNIDTGMGLERMACVMQGTDSIFDVDTIKYILDGVVEKSGVTYHDGAEPTDVSIRIITDHLRAMTFMIADGIMPSNEGRGYVLRRLLRRAARHGRILGIEGSFLVALSNRVIEVSGEAYPELLEKKEYIQKIIQVEEDNFAATIDKGEEIIAGYIDDLKQTGKTVLDGASVFKLYDTFGFPLELTEEILAENGFTADKEGFQTHMQAQKELARKNRKSNEDEGWDKNELDLDIPKTVFTGYDTLLDTGKILAILADGKLTDSVSEGQKAVVLVDQTPFYAEGGGQVCDKGFMSTVTEADDEKIFDAEVIKVEKKDGIFYHTVMVLANSIHVGDEVLLTVDPEKRNAAARNHTATHLLQKALKEVVGNHVEQAGSMVNESMLRFDFSHFEAVTSEQLAKVEAIVNEMIDNCLPVTTAEMSLEEAQKTGAMALFGEKYGSTVRVVNAGDWSIELCGGTHVKNTGEIGAFKIISEGGVASGVRRIEAVTGAGVLQAAKQAENILGQVCEALKCNKTVLADKAKSMAEELKALKKELEEMKKAAEESGSQE